MLATWPMVFAALIAGLIMGLLAPSPSPQQRAESSTARSAAPVPPPAAPRAPVIEQALREAGHANASKEPVAEAKPEKQNCEQQAWPYLSALCIDRTVKSPDAVQIVNVRAAEPVFALSEKQEMAKQDNSADKKASKEAAPTKPAQPVSTQARSQNEAPATRRADRPRPRLWAEEERRYFEVPDDWDGPRPRAYVQPDGRVIYVYPERRHFQRRLPDGW